MNLAIKLFIIGIIGNKFSSFSLKRYLSSKKELTLNPWFVTGFTDAEGCFHAVVAKKPNLNMGWELRLDFSISQHKEDLELLNQIKEFFGVGRVVKHGLNTYVYKVTSIKELRVIIDHFNNFPLYTQKQADYLIFQ